MLTLAAATRVYLASAPIDLRAGHDGLFARVRDALGHDPASGHLFVFYGRRKDRIKILLAQRGGLVVYYKRLERGRFAIPPIPAATASLELDAVALGMLLDGIDLTHVRRPPLWEPPPARR